MTSKERMLIAMKGGQPDCVPVAPDISNMIPCRLTGKPFWDIYLFQDPPRWQAYIEAVKYFGFDGFLGPVFSLEEPARGDEPPWTTVIIQRTEDRMVTRAYQETEWGDLRWAPNIGIVDRTQPATSKPATVLNLPDTPTEWEPLEGVREWPKGEALLRLVKETMGQDGVVAAPY